MSNDEMVALINAFWIENPNPTPCPFCRSENLNMHWRKSRYREGGVFYFVKCSRCGASSGARDTLEETHKMWQERN